jgi:nicotinamide riboside kinase
MRIAIDGAQSTGKTTLFNHLMEIPLLKSFRFIPEPARSIAKEFGIESAADWQPLLNDAARLSEFFRREEEWLAKEEETSVPFIVDSSFYLIQAYKSCMLKQEFVLPTVSPQYDLILYCPCTNDFEDDGFRFSMGRQAVDQTYRDALSVIPVQHFIELPIGADRNRVALESIAAIGALLRD